MNEPKSVVHAIEAHHADVEPATIEAVLVQAADAISAGRPGARRETLESYIKRLEKLEAVANCHKGVEKTYAMQAGREIRVMVKPEQINDADAVVLARDIAKQIEDELEYPGPDQGHGHPREPRGRLRQVVDSTVTAVTWDAPAIAVGASFRIRPLQGGERARLPRT